MVQLIEHSSYGAAVTRRRWLSDVPTVTPSVEAGAGDGDPLFWWRSGPKWPKLYG